MGDTSFRNFYAGYLNAVLNFFAQNFRNLHRRAAQRLFIPVFGNVVRILAGDLANRRVALRGYVGYIIIYIKDGTRRIDDLPDDDDADLDRISFLIVDLLLLIIYTYIYFSDPYRQSDPTRG